MRPSYGARKCASSIKRGIRHVHALAWKEDCSDFLHASGCAEVLASTISERPRGGSKIACFCGTNPSSEVARHSGQGFYSSPDLIGMFKIFVSRKYLQSFKFQLCKPGR